MKIRVLIGIMGLDQHEVGALGVAGMLRDAGMEVIYVGRLNTPTTIARTAVEEDVDIIGLSCHSWEYIQFIPELMNLLKEEDAGIGVIVGGSIITPSDARDLKHKGVVEVFGPDSNKETIVASIMEICGQRRQG